MTVIDSTTGAPVAEGAHGTMVRHGVVAVLWPYGSRGLAPDDTLLSLAATPSSGGTFLVTVSRPGYTTWQRGNIVVEETNCGVATTSITARLEPAP